MSFYGEDSQPSQDSVLTVTDENRQEVLYFAYGSNLSTDQMRHRCPFSTPIGLAHLSGWKWIINKRGYANVVQLPAPRSRSENKEAGGPGVYGLLYLLPPGDEDRLDEYEGVPWAYSKFQTEVRWVRDEQGREKDEAVVALVYIDLERTQEGVSKTEYVGRMEEGIRQAKEWGLEEGYAETVMRGFWKGTGRWEDENDDNEEPHDDGSIGKEQ